MSDLPRFYTAAEVSEATGMTVDWLWRQARLQKIPHHKLGGRYRWTDEDLKEMSRQTAVAAVTPSWGLEDLVPIRGSRPRKSKN